MRIFLDANILFSAAKSDGAIRRLLALLHEAGHECCADGFVIEEARRNLEVKMPGSQAALDAVLSRVKVAGAVRHAVIPAAARKLAEKDQPVLAAAIRLGCEALLTGDRTHFGAWYGKQLGGVKIYSPRLLAEALRLL
jgi:predicted nucleic acid-binding protein